MKLFTKIIIALAGSIITNGSYADVDGSENVICNAAEILECTPNNECSRISAREAEIPRFFQIDFASKEITRTEATGEDITSPIERSEVIDGRIILQGAEDGYENVPDGIGWSLSVNQTNGDMILTGSGADTAFVIFGACTTF